MKQATEDTRNRAIASWKAGTPINQICSVLGINRRTFYNWRKRDESGGQQLPLPKGHRKCILNDAHMQKIKELYESNPSLYAREVLIKLNLNCDIGVIYRALAKLGFTLKKRDKSITKK